jgi:hypothetical protein
MRYKVLLHRTGEGISVSVTENEALDNIRDAIQEYLAGLSDQFQGAEVRDVEVTV